MSLKSQSWKQLVVGRFCNFLAAKPFSILNLKKLLCVTPCTFPLCIGGYLGISLFLYLHQFTLEQDVTSRRNGGSTIYTPMIRMSHSLTPQLPLSSYTLMTFQFLREPDDDITRDLITSQPRLIPIV